MGRKAGTHLISFSMGARSSSAMNPMVSPASAISPQIEIKMSAQRSIRRRDAL